MLLQSDILAALNGESLRQMKKVLDRSEDLDLANSALSKRLKARVRELEKARNKAAVDDDEAGAAQPMLDDDEMKRQREERLRRASVPKFHFSKFSRIRCVCFCFFAVKRSCAPM